MLNLLRDGRAVGGFEVELDRLLHHGLEVGDLQRDGPAVCGELRRGDVEQVAALLLRVFNGELG
jgi:hypothetical protein